MKDRAPFKLITLFRAHNLLLSVASFVLMLLLGEEVIRIGSSLARMAFCVLKRPSHR